MHHICLQAVGQGFVLEVQLVEDQQHPNYPSILRAKLAIALVEYPELLMLEEFAIAAGADPVHH